MTTRVILRGRTAWASRDSNPKHVAGAQLPSPRLIDKEGKDISGPIAKDDPRSPFREGTPYRCPEDNVYYRVVRKLEPTQGWATAGFWLDRWPAIRFKHILEFIDRGWMDAAIEANSPTKRFRCRDERPILKWIKDHQTKPKAR